MAHDVNALLAELTALRLRDLKARYEKELGKQEGDVHTDVTPWHAQKDSNLRPTA